MDVKLALLADYSNISREGKLNILGVFDLIRARGFPAVHRSMQLIMMLEAESVEADTDKDIQVKLIDADGRKVFEIGAQMKLPSPRPGEMIKSNQMLNLNDIRFEKPGDYVFHIMINGDLKRSVPVKLIQARP